MLHLKNLQWITRCISHSNEDIQSATSMAKEAMQMFNQNPALIPRNYYLYVISSKLAQ